MEHLASLVSELAFISVKLDGLLAAYLLLSLTRKPFYLSVEAL